MNRKIFITAVILMLTVKYSIGQPSDSLFTDNNPKLTEQEGHWLNERFTTDGFDLKNKYIGFVELYSDGIFGLGKLNWLHPTKKRFIRRDFNKFSHRLIILDTGQKTITRGYDALLVFVNKKDNGKLDRLNIEKLVYDTKNRYPQIPIDAGVDTNSRLSTANAVFLNELYRAGLYPKTDYDFKGKKVAILNSHCRFDKIEIVNIADYVKRIKSQLDVHGSAMTDYTHYLSAEQRKESGGYDVIIEYPCKKGLLVTSLISFLKQNGT